MLLKYIRKWSLNDLQVKFTLQFIANLFTNSQIRKKTSSFKHAAWNKDSILCFWRDTILASDHVTSLPLTLYRSRSCADMLRGERADVTDLFLFSWPWWMGSVVKHNMLKKHFQAVRVSRKKHICYNAINIERDLVVYRLCLLLFYLLV